jgi:L-amino acid N-acyltransferase YncA
VRQAPGDAHDKRARAAAGARGGTGSPAARSRRSTAAALASRGVVAATHRIRDATEADWPGIWPFLHAIVAAGDTFSYDPAMDEATARAMWMVGPPGRATVAVAPDGHVLGTANMYANRPGPGAHVASGNVMVAAEHQGRGVGRALLADLLEWALEKGFRGVQFNAVAASNVRAVGLYESLGFAVIGTVPERFLHPMEGFVGLHVMYRPLASQHD